MKLKVITEIMLTLLLISMLTLAFNIQPARATRTIYIRADGFEVNRLGFNPLSNDTNSNGCEVGFVENEKGE